MRILFFCQYFPPEPGAPAARTHEHAREWVRRGHDVTVVCGLPHYPEGVVAEGYRGRWLVDEKVDGIRVLRCWLYAAPNRGALRRSFSFLTFLITATLTAMFKSGKCDVVAATSPQLLCGLAGWLVAAWKRKPFVFEVRDLWPKQIVDLGVITTPWVIRPLEALERFLYRRARAVVTVSPATSDALVERGAPRDKTPCVPNGIDLDFFKPMPRQNAIREKHGWGDDYVALYIGAHGLSQGLEVVLGAADGMRLRKGLRFVFVGAGARKIELMGQAAARGLTNVQFLPSVTKADMPGYYNAADVCLVPLLQRDVFLTNIPSKMFEIMACARPMVLGVRGQAKQLLEDAGAGLLIPPEDSVALANAIDMLINDPERARRLGEAGRRYAERHFSRADRAAAYLEVFEKVLGKAGTDTHGRTRTHTDG